MFLYRIDGFVQSIGFRACFGKDWSAPKGVFVALTRDSVVFPTPKNTQTMGRRLLRPPARWCGFDTFLPDLLESQNFRLVAARYQAQQLEDSPPRRSYAAIHFRFARLPAPIETTAVELNHENLTWYAIEMLRAACWTVQVYENPYIQDGDYVRGSYGLQFNLTERDYLFADDLVHGRLGREEPRMVHYRDEIGKTDRMVPYTPKCVICLRGEELHIEDW